MQKLLEGVLKSTTILLKDINLNEALSSCISLLAEAQNIDKCFIYKTNPEQEQLQYSYENKQCEFCVQKDSCNFDLEGISSENFPELFQMLFENKTYYATVAENSSTSFKAYMELKQIKACLFVPIFSEELFWGWISYIDCREIREWSSIEITALVAAANSIGIRISTDNKALALSETVKQLDFFIKTAKQAIWNKNLITNQFNYSYNWEGVLGYSSEEVTSSATFYKSLLHKDDVNRIETELKDFLDGKSEVYTGVKRMLHKKGHYVWLRYNAKVKRNMQGIPIEIMGTDVDFTDVVEKELKLQISEEKYRFITENTIDVISQFSPEGIYLYSSNSIKKVTGYEPEELLGTSPYKHIHPDDIPHVTQRHKEFVTNKISKGMIYRYKTKSGEYIWLETFSIPIYDSNGVLQKLQTSSRDISERIKSEETLKSALQKERQLNELKSKFVSTVSHQFRTPFTVIYSNTELIELKMAQTAMPASLNLSTYTSRIKNEVQRMTELMENVLIYGKHEANHIKKSIKPIRFTAFCQSFIATYFQNQPDGRSIEFSFEGDEQLVYSDEELLVHILTNVISNAFKYSVNKKSPKMNVEYLQNDFKIHVIDYGIGVPKDDVSQLFNAFYRASNTSTIVGSGLGLSIIDQFTTLLGGKIKFTSKENYGSKVTLQFPYVLINQP